MDGGPPPLSLPGAFIGAYALLPLLKSSSGGDGAEHGLIAGPIGGISTFFRVFTTSCEVLLYLRPQQDDAILNESIYSMIVISVEDPRGSSAGQRML